MDGLDLPRAWLNAFATAINARALRRGLTYDLLFKALSAALLTAPATWLLSQLIMASGTRSIANEAVVEFLLSPSGAAFVVLALGFAIAALYAELAGLIHIAVGTSRGRAPHWIEALAVSVSALPRLLRLALRQAAFLLGWLAAPAAIAALIAVLLLGEHDINWYLAERPPEFLLAVLFGALLLAVSAGVVARLAVDWLFAIPLCLYERLHGRASLRRSRELATGRRARILALLVFSFAATALVFATLFWLADMAIAVVLAPIQNIRILVIVTGIAVALLTLLGVLASYALLAVYATVVAKLYLDVGGVGVASRAAADVPARRQPGLSVAAILGLLAALGIGSGLIISEGLLAVRINGVPQVTAHRGSSLLAPENTLAAIDRAIRDGADFAEIDVQETADGALVLLHDSDLMRIAGLPTKVRDIEFEALRRIDAGGWFSADFAGERVPALEEALALASDKIGLNIELKFNGHERRLVERTVELVRAFGCVERCVITSLSQPGLRQVRTLAPELRIGQIVTVAVGDVTRLDVDLLSMSLDQVTAAQVRANRAAGLATHVWTVNRPEDMTRVIDYGVDNIITDDPVRLRTLLAERAALSEGELLLLSLSRQLRD